MGKPRVLIVGSHRPDNEGMRNDLATFGDCVHQLVRELRDRHGIKAFTICSFSSNTVDSYVLEELRQERNGLSVDVVFPENQTDAEFVGKIAELTEALKPGVISPVGVAGGWRPTHLRALRGCDLVIAIGGSDRGTATVFYSAEVMGVPVVLVPGFGGAAAKGWRDFKRYYNPSEQVTLQADPKSASWARDVGAAAVSVHSRNPFSSSKPSLLLLSLGAILMGFCGWFTAQWNLSRNEPYPSAIVGLVFGLVAAAFMGHLLEKRASFGSLGFTDHLRLLILAVGTTFAVVMTTELASFLLSGEGKMVTHTVTESRGLLIRLSVVSFFAGILADDYFERLIKKARQAIP